MSKVEKIDKNTLRYIQMLEEKIDEMSHKLEKVLAYLNELEREKRMIKYEVNRETGKVTYLN